MELADSLKAIANSIRGCTDKTELMTLDQMSEEISDIHTVKEFLAERNCAKLFFEFNTYKTIPDGLIRFSETSDVTDMRFMFGNCTKLTSVPLFDTSKVTNMNGMFNNCTALTSVPLFDTSKVTNMNSMFNNCSTLTSAPLFDTSNVTNMSFMFYYCIALTTVPLYSTRNVTDMNRMFYNCTALTSVHLFDTSKVTNMNSMFGNCTKLTSVLSFDMRAVTYTSSMFNNCTNLTDCLLNNIKMNLQVGSGTTYGHLLTVESLLHLIKELVNVGSSRTLTIGTANLRKLANTYVKLIDITDEMRAEDEFIDQKLPFEVCESTDEGAMLISDYALSKLWTIK